MTADRTAAIAARLAAAPPGPWDVYVDEPEYRHEDPWRIHVQRAGVSKHDDAATTGDRDLFANAPVDLA